MPTTITGSVRVTAGKALEKTLSLGGPLSANRTIALVSQFAAGTAVNQINRGFADSGSLLDAADVTYDLADGTLDDAAGDEVAFSRVKAVIVKNTSTAGSGVKIDATASAGFENSTSANGVEIMPGGMFLITYPGAGYAVTAPGTGGQDEITLTNLGETTQTYEILILGLGLPA